MKQYIDKSDIKTEIEKLRMNHGCVFNEYDAGFSEGRCSAFDEVLSFLNTIEVKEVDEEVMKNVVLETKVMKDSDGDGIDTPYEEWLTLEDTEIPFIPDNIGLKDGDKVKVIIIKQ